MVVVLVRYRDDIGRFGDRRVLNAAVKTTGFVRVGDDPRALL
jgi:hypothetical protein